MAAGSLIAKDRLVQSMPNVALALHLLNEACSPHSFWRPYIGDCVYVCTSVCV